MERVEERLTVSYLVLSFSWHSYSYAPMMRQVVFLSFFIIALQLNAQDDIIANIGAALKTSSAKELVKYCHSSVEIQENGVSKTYNKPQAEIILKAFFEKNPSRGYRKVHEGSSNEGYIYSIGQFSTDNGSYRVYYLLKKGADTHTIHTISFSKE
ncbi:MAG: hypothetical protein ACI8QD_000837 [Cyclobacteriaceae bacterium]|jgi:hypothetical protein